MCVMTLVGRLGAWRLHGRKLLWVCGVAMARSGNFGSQLEGEASLWRPEGDSRVGVISVWVNGTASVHRSGGHPQ